jgi:hypothetical protein
MVADETALILALTSDTADTLLRKIGESGARRVQLLVPEGVAGLQQRAQLERLRTLVERSGVALTLISSDPDTLRAARLGGLETLQVRDAHVKAPPQSSSPESPYATRVLDHEPARGGVPHHIAEDLSAGDAAFLDALDDLDAIPPARPAGLAPEDEDLFTALEGISAPSGRRAPSPDDDFADALDSIGADEEDLRRDPTHRTTETPATPRRIRPEDIELSTEEKTRASQTGRRSATPPAPPRPPRSAPDSPAPTPARGRTSYESKPAGSRRQSLLIPILIALILLAALGVAAFIVMGNRVTLSVTPPVRTSQIEPINAMPVPVVAPGSGSGGTAVEAEGISSDVAVSVSGRITEFTMAPSGTAQGTVTILNGASQPITLPAGSEFVAVKADGQEVPFVSNADVTIPAAVTTDQGTQIITTRGVAQVGLVARSAGSASNVDANSISRITPTGGQPFSVSSGTLLTQHGPIQGGSEAQVWIVKDSDVHALLPEGLGQLETQARQLLKGLATARNLQLELTTITPHRANLEQLEGVVYTASPAIGETVDPQNPTFTLTIQARYRALTSATNTQLEQQLGSALTEQLRQAGLLKPGDCKAPAITGWLWDGERLTVDGQIGPNTHDPACGAGLSDAVIRQVREAVRGKSRAEAEVALQNLQQQGLIGTYVLPNVKQLPSWDFQLQVETL